MAKTEKPSVVYGELILFALRNDAGQITTEDFFRYLDAWKQVRLWEAQGESRASLMETSGICPPDGPPANEPEPQNGEPPEEKPKKSPPNLAARRKKVIEALEARKEAGLTLEAIVTASGGKVELADLLDILERKPVPMAIYDAAWKAIKATPKALPETGKNGEGG